MKKQRQSVRKALCIAVFLLIFITGLSVFRAKAAEEAESAAEEYIPAVTEVQTEAEETQAEAVETQTEAEEAQSEAEETQTEAEEVQTEAEETQTEAEEAQSEAEEAQTEAEETQAEAEETQTEAGETEEDPEEDEEDPVLEEVKTLLAGIDSLEEMQYYRVTVTRDVFRNANGAYSSGNYENRPEQHQEAQSRYQAYLEDMFAKREAAKTAYEALTDEQKAQIAADETAAANLAKLTPYDELPTAWLTQDRLIIAQTSQTAEQLQLPVSVTPTTDPDDPYIYEFVRAYELSMAYSEAGYPCTYAMVDTTAVGDTWMPNEVYNYGTSNYLVAYCCDADVNAHRGMRYKRINLEDADYYSEERARHIRTIVLNSYPFVSIEEMKQYLVDNGFDPETARALTRSDLIAAVQWAVWFYSNYEEDTAYRGTAALMEARDRRDYLLLPSLHDYRNEDWTWYLIAPGDYYSCSAYRYTFYEDVQQRVDALTQFLLSLPGTDPEDKQIAISSIEIARTALLPGEDGTFEIDLNVFLNHGTVSAGDDVTIDAVAISEDGTVTRCIPTPVTVGEKTVYRVTVTAKDGDTVNIIVNGTQVLERGVYFYETVGGHEESQCFVNVAEGSTRVHAEKSFTFHRDAEMGIRVFKTASGSGLPLSDIVFRVYRVDPAEGETIGEEPTAEEIVKYATDANLAGTLTTDDTGYAFLQLERGCYLVVEELNAEKVKETVPPFYVTLPNPTEVSGDDGVTTVEYQDIVPLYIENIPLGAAEAQFEVTKEFNDWGKADSFTFELQAVTENAPMPKETTVAATKEKPVAVFDKLAFDKAGTYEYIITEINDGADGVAYDTAEHHVVVTVTKTDGSNELSAEVKYDGSASLVITNTYSPVTAPIEVTKEFNDWGKADSFVFVLSAADGMPLPENTRVTATKDAPTVSFGEVTFEKAGVYEYVITEIDGGADGVAYDTAEHHVVVTVTKADDTNELSAEVKYDGAASLVITNTFAPAQAAPEITKVLTGRDWNESDSFTFTLAAVTEGAPLPEETSGTATKNQPTVYFGTISFDKAGTYEYTLTEEDGGIPGITYDTTPHKVLITVTKDETNALSAAVSYDGQSKLAVENRYQAEPVTVVFGGRKTVEGQPEDKVSFRFILKETTEGADYQDELVISGQGSGSFKPIRFENTGVYTFEIREEVGSEKGWTYDTRTYTVTVTVTDDGAGQLTAAVEGLEDSTAEFNNTYVPETTPEETTPEETTPEETTPEETTPAETTPEETTPEETTPEETTPAGTTPAETTPVETTPAGTTPAEQPDTGEGNALLLWGIMLGISCLMGTLVLLFRKRVDVQ